MFNLEVQLHLYYSSKNNKAELKLRFNLYLQNMLLNLDTALNNLKHTPRYPRTQLQIKLVSILSNVFVK